MQCLGNIHTIEYSLYRFYFFIMNPSYSPYPLYQSGAASSNLNREYLVSCQTQFIPYQRTIIEYEEIEEVELVRSERKIIEYEEIRRTERVPVERAYTEYYTVDHITEMVPQTISETRVQYEQVETIHNKVEYYPVERHVIYRPEDRFHISQLIDNGQVYADPRAEAATFAAQNTTQNTAQTTSQMRSVAYPVYRPDMDIMSEVQKGEGFLSNFRNSQQVNSSGEQKQFKRWDERER